MKEDVQRKKWLEEGDTKKDGCESCAGGTAFLPDQVGATNHGSPNSL